MALSSQLQDKNIINIFWFLCLEANDKVSLHIITYFYLFFIV